MIAYPKRKILTLILLYCLFCFIELSAAQRNQNSDNNTLKINDLTQNIDGLRHEVKNHETEIRMFDEKLKNLDYIIENIRDTLSDSTKYQKDLLKGNTANLDVKFNSLETNLKSLVADMRQFKVNANDTITTLAQYKQKLTELEKTLLQQNQDIEHMQGAIRSLIDLAQVKTQSSFKTVESLDCSDPNLYIVKSGDSLEKIARAYKISIQALKEFNGLSSDRIVVGKPLKIPGK